MPYMWLMVSLLCISYYRIDNMRISTLYLLLTLLILGGCNARQADEQALHCINFQEGSRQFVEPMLSKYVSALKYTPIETRDSVLLGDVGSHFVADDSLMFFVSGQKQRCIHIFSRDGKYIKDIGAKGNGPGEYIAIRSMSIIPNINVLVVEGGWNIVYYSIDNGKCLTKCNLNDFFDTSKDIVTYFKGQKYTNYNISYGNFIHHNNSIYATAGDGTTLDQLLIKMDHTFSVDTIVKMRQSTLDVGMPRVAVSQLYTYNNNIHIIHGLCDTVYVWTNEKLYPHIAFDYGNLLSLSTMPQIKKTHPFFSPNTRHLSTKIATLIISNTDIFMETDLFIIGTVFFPKDYVIENNLRPQSHFLYDKQTRTTKLLKYPEDEYQAGFTNDIDGGMPFWPTKRIDDKLYQFVDAGTFIEMSEKYNSPEMKRIAATLTEDSNPVVIEATLK